MCRVSHTHSLIHHRNGAAINDLLCVEWDIKLYTLTYHRNGAAINVYITATVATATNIMTTSTTDYYDSDNRASTLLHVCAEFDWSDVWT